MEKSREGSIFDIVQHSSAVQDVAQSLVVVVLFLLSAVWTAEEDDDDNLHELNVRVANRQ